MALQSLHYYYCNRTTTIITLCKIVTCSGPSSVRGTRAPTDDEIEAQLRRLAEL